MRISFTSSARIALALAEFCLLCGSLGGQARAQDLQTGLGRLYVRPMDNQLDVYLIDRIVKTRLPVVVSPNESRADCVMLLAPTNSESTAGVAKNDAGKSDHKFVLVDLHARRITWVTSVKTKDLSSLSGAAEKHLAATIVGGMQHDGAFCGGSPFATPTQNMEDRVKAFKPPMFNWDF